MTVSDLNTSEYHNYYETYISKVPKHLKLNAGYKLGAEQLIAFFNGIPKDKLEYRYAPGKWTIKEVLQHIIDTERVFAYRCFRFARHDDTPLAGFEQDDYILPSQANSKSIEALLEEYHVVRQNTMVLLNSFSRTDLEHVGSANASSMSARAAAFIILGHEIHHMTVIEALYLGS